MNPESTAVQCLGRPMYLGTLYDYPSDKVVTGQTMWSSDQRDKHRQQAQATSSVVKVVANDSMQAKAELMGLTNNSKLSLCAQLTQLEGSAKYWDDRRSTLREVD